jgi:glycosyltransferase involved in cell wall biosynthesis
MRGAEMFAVRIAARLERSGLSNALCSLYPSARRADRFETAGIKVYELDVRPTLLDRFVRLDPLVLLRLRRVLRDFRPDIIVGHGSDTLKYTALAGMIHRHARTVYKNIGTASYWANTRPRVWFNKLWLRGIDCAVSVSEFTRQDFIHHYGFTETRSVFIPNAIQIEDFTATSDPAVRGQVRQEIGVCEGDVVIAMVGSLSRGKGQDDLIRAISRLSGQQLPVKLALVGDGPERERLVRLSQAKGVSGRIAFMGLRRDVPHVLAGADIFALASASEGMPGVLIEAGLSGLPSVAYDVGGVREVLKDRSTGLLIRAGDFAGLTDALGQLCVNPGQRAALGQNARARCRARFDIASVARQYEQLFEQLLTDTTRLQLSAPVARRDDTVS